MLASQLTSVREMRKCVEVSIATVPSESAADALVWRESTYWQRTGPNSLCGCEQPSVKKREGGVGRTGADDVEHNERKASPVPSLV